MRVTLNGYVVASDDQWLFDWFEIAAFSPETVRNAIKNNPEGEELTLEINSGGGDVFAGFEIYSMLRAAKCRTVAQVQSIAASAASTVMIGCDRVELSPVAQVMIHLPACCSEGNYHDHLASVEILDSITQSILNAYELKCAGRASRSELNDMMEHETWLPAQNAVRIGLADGVMFDGDELSESTAAKVGAGIRNFVNSVGMPNVQLLRAEYERRTKNKDEVNPAGSDPASTMPWQASARLELEKKRF